MKKIISLLLIIAMLFSISACKRSDTDDDVAVAVGESDKAESKTEEQENTEDDVPASPQNQDDTQAEENKTESEKPVQQENKTETQESLQEENKTETQEPSQEEDKTEAETPAHQQATTLKYPELQELNKQLQREFALEGKNYPTDVYLSEYLPLKEGLVTKKSKGDGTYYYQAQKDFVTKEPITEQMIEAAKEYPYGENEVFNPDNSRLVNHIPSSEEGFLMYNRDDYDSPLAYVEEFIKNDYVIKGHFEQSYGTAYAYYDVDGMSVSNRCNYKTNEYTLHNFVIEKVYTDNCEYKAGDVIEIAFPGTVLQAINGFYRATATRGQYTYKNFNNATLEERTFILSVMPKNEQSIYRDIVRVSNIRQNVYEQVPDRDDEDDVLSREILEKYK